MVDEAHLEIIAIGAQGDGVADGDVYVPGGLPGEIWRRTGPDKFILEGPKSPDRTEPMCRHFDVCGGCVAQHMSPNVYGNWKRQIVETVLAREGLEADIRPLWRHPEGRRRRAALQLVRSGNQVRVGFRERRGHTVFDMAMCPVLDPSVVEALPGLRKIGELILADGDDARVTVTRAMDGLVVGIDTARKTRQLKPSVQSKIAQLGRSINAHRLMLNGDMVAAHGSAKLRFGAADVEIPDLCFLQAMPEAELEMQRLVCEGLAGVKKVADLFCGVGTFTFPLAKAARVSGYDSDRAAIDALVAAVRHAQGLKPIIALRRDLFRQPLGERELRAYDGVVINPPRAGAKAQCEALAISKLRRVED